MDNIVKILQTALKKHREILDIIIFGSSKKGKGRPDDVDIAVITKEDLRRSKVDEILGDTIKWDITVISTENFDTFLWITLIREGFSVKHNKYLHEVYGIEPIVLFTYKLTKLTPSQKVMFERGFKKMTVNKRLGNGVVMVPITHSEEFKDLLRRWNIEYDARDYGLLPFVRKSDLFE